MNGRAGSEDLPSLSQRTEDITTAIIRQVFLGAYTGAQMLQVVTILSLLNSKFSRDRVGLEILSPDI